MFNKWNNRLKGYFYRLHNGVPRNYTPATPNESYYLLEEKKYKLAIILFFITFCTTTVAGIKFNNIALTKESSLLQLLLAGMTFSIPTMIIILAHELGHYFAAKKFFVHTTPPLFIPFPFVGGDILTFGTMGAVIKIKSAIPDRRALFYIGAMGPLMGMVFSVIALFVGIYLSEVKLIPNAASGTVFFGEPLLFKGISYLFHGQIAKGYDIYLSGPGFAGWFGCLITSLNLLPIGQLDGAHILYALTGSRQRIFGWIAVAGLLVMSYFFMGWFIWIIFTFSFLKVGHPPVPQSTPLTIREKIIGWSIALLLFITFIPVPISLM